MLDRVKNLFSPPTFADNAKKLRAESLHYGSIFLFMFMLIQFWINLTFGSEAEKAANWLVGLIALVQIIVQLMIRRGYVNAASFILLTVGWAVMTEICRKVGSVNDEAVFGYVIVIIAAGYLLGWRIATVYTLASIAAIWWLAYLEINGLLVPDIADAYRTAIDLTIVFILIFFVVYFLIKTLAKALENAQRELDERVRIESEREKLITQLSEEITVRKRAQTKLQQLARTDPLTGLFNRRYFFEIAKKEFAEASRYNRPLSVVVLDLDMFKNINDAYGHLAGDQVLVHIGDLLCKETREPDIPARYGGEEFIILMPETDYVSAKFFTERLRQLVEESRVYYENYSISLTVSIGIAQKNNKESAETLDQLISKADQALYKAKDKGRNRVICYLEG